MSRARIRIVGPRIDRQQRFVLGSLLVHVALATGIVWVSGLRRGPLIPPDAVMVELVGAAGAPAAVAAAPQPPAPTPPAPEPEPEPEPAPPDEGVTMQPDEPVERKPEKKPEPKETPPPKPRPKPTPPVESPAEAPAEGTASGGGAVASGSAAEGASVSAMIGGGAAYDWYRAAVTNALYSRWSRPILSGIREPQEVQVDFEIMRDGRIRGLRVAVSSGIPSLDRSALRAVSDAVPLPPLPGTLNDPYLPASFVFRLYPEGY